MIGHLGSRVSALLDGDLPPAEEERAWEHVHVCHPCRDLVEREGWVKTRLAELGHCAPATQPSMEESLRASLLRLAPDGASPMQRHALEHSVLAAPARSRARHLSVLGGGAVGVAVLGVLAMGAVPANAPPTDRRGPVTSLPSTPGTESPTVTRYSSGPAFVRQGALRETLVP